jgi:hypothetical protein
VTWQDLRRWAEAQICQEEDDAEAGESSHASNTHPETRTLFLPLLSLLRQRPGMDPGQSYELKS